MFLHRGEADSLTAEDFPVGAPEFGGFGRPAVELISVRSQNQPEKIKKGRRWRRERFTRLAETHFGPSGRPRRVTGADLSDSVTVMHTWYITWKADGLTSRIQILNVFFYPPTPWNSSAREKAAERAWREENCHFQVRFRCSFFWFCQKAAVLLR